MQGARSIPTSSGTPVRHPSDTLGAVRKQKLLDQLREALRSCHYSRRTEQTYCRRVKRFVSLHNIPPRFDIRSQRVCWKTVTTFANSKDFWATRT